MRNFELQITSLGDETSRKSHRSSLLQFLDKLALDDETRQRIGKNPLRIFDDKRESIQKLLVDAPLLIDFLSSQSVEKFELLKEALTSLEIPFVVNPRMVRGLDYYTGTAFEFVHKGLGAQSGIGGGGRYDGLMSILGGQDLSGIGFGLGIDRIILAMESEGLIDSERNNQDYLDLFIIPIEPAAKVKALQLIEDCRAKGFVGEIGFGDRSLKGAMKAADKLRARHVLVLGSEEIESGRGKLKRMSDGFEESITLDSLIEALTGDL